MFRTFKGGVLAAATMVALAAPAGAGCLDQVAELEQRLNQLEAAEAQQQAAGGTTVEMTTAGGGEVEVTVEEEGQGGTQPQENWFGSPPSREGAEEQLQNAREMAQLGDEQGCAGHVEQAAQILTAIEQQQ